MVKSKFVVELNSILYPVLSYSVRQGGEVEVEWRSSGRIDVVVPDKIACHVTVRATRYLYCERIPTTLIRKRERLQLKKETMEFTRVKYG